MKIHFAKSYLKFNLRERNISLERIISNTNIIEETTFL